MPLALALRRGQDFYVNDVQVVVKRVHETEALFEIEVPSTGRHYTVTDAAKVEFKEVDGVGLFAGDRAQLGVARIVIDAPRSIVVLRGDRYRAGPAPRNFPPAGDATVSKVAYGSRWK